MKNTDHLYREYDKINQIFKSYNHLYHKLAVFYDLSDSAVDILYALRWFKEPCTPTDITDFCCCSKQTIHSSLKKMEADGLLEISISPQNKKNRIVRLTDKGNEIADRTVQKIIDTEIRSFAALSEKERETLIAIQTKQLEAFRKETETIFNDKQGIDQK